VKEQPEVARAIKTLEEFQVRVTRDQKQVAELQRLAEERQRKEFSEWQAENEQRWKKELLRWEYTTQEQLKVNQRLADHFPPLEQTMGLLRREVEALWRIQEALGQQHMTEAQHLLDVIGASLDARPKPEK